MVVIHTRLLNIYRLSLIHILELREREVKLMKDQLDGLDAYAAGTSTINFVFDRYISVSYTHLDVYKRQPLRK